MSHLTAGGTILTVVCAKCVNYTFCKMRHFLFWRSYPGQWTYSGFVSYRNDWERRAHTYFGCGNAIPIFIWISTKRRTYSEILWAVNKEVRWAQFRSPQQMLKRALELRISLQYHISETDWPCYDCRIWYSWTLLVLDWIILIQCHTWTNC